MMSDCPKSFTEEIRNFLKGYGFECLVQVRNSFEAVVASAKKTGAVVCAEEHNMCGGLGELIAGVLASNAPTPVEYINGGDRFGQSGTPAQLLKAYDMDAEHIAEAAKRAIARK